MVVAMALRRKKGPLVPWWLWMTAGMILAIWMMPAGGW
jgi:hypothetical protein